MKTMSFADAIESALAQAMAEDPRIIIFGEDVQLIRRNLLVRFGEKRVLATPISEGAFVGAAVTSGLLVVYLYGFAMYPLPITHWVKWLGNISAVLLVLGGVVLLLNRLKGDRQSGSSTAFDSFFLGIVLAVIATGVLTEAGRFLFDPATACVIYVMHLGVVLTLFFTFPYSKFAHLL